MTGGLNNFRKGLLFAIQKENIESLGDLKGYDETKLLTHIKLSVKKQDRFQAIIEAAELSD